MDSPTVLCIDDHQQALELRKAALESHDYRVKIASNGHTAMKMLEETPVAAVLLDYRPEGVDAEAVACHIKQRFPALPVILLSAYSGMPEPILWLVDDYVMRSEPPERLVRAVQRVTRLTNAEAAHRLTASSLPEHVRRPIRTRLRDEHRAA